MIARCSSCLFSLDACICGTSASVKQKDYIVTVSYAIKVKAHNKFEAIELAQDMALGNAYVLDTFDVLQVKEQYLQ